jgi:type I restriction enzyme S subunit
VNLTLKPYGEYKPSKLESLGQIPSHWQEIRAKYLFREIDDRSVTGDEEMLSVSHITGVTPRSEKNVTMFMAESNVGQKRCRENDLVINTMWAWMGALGAARNDGIVSPAYGVYRPVKDSCLVPEYADFLLRSPEYVTEYNRRSTGVNSSRLRLYPEEFLGIQIPVPPVEEQRCIVEFLRHLNRGLGCVVAAKKKQLALIGEIRNSLTEETLRSPQTKSMRLGSVAELISRSIDRQSDRLYTPIGLFNRGRGIFHKGLTRGTDLGDSSFFWIREGDLVISGQFAWEGAASLASARDSGCVASHRYAVLQGRPQFVASAVLLALLKTQFGAMLLNENSRGAAGRNRPLNTRTLFKEKLPIPPLSLQKRIVDVVLIEAKITESIRDLTNVIRDCRKRIVADVVTGKLDVRGVELPELDVVEEVSDVEEEELEDSEELVAVEESADAD